LTAIASVASFFVSRVDTEVDQRLEALAAEANGTRETAFSRCAARLPSRTPSLRISLFCAELAGARWRALSERGAKCQRPLWASTSAKNPAYRDVHLR
jgi:transaldolase